MTHKASSSCRSAVWLAKVFALVFCCVGGIAGTAAADNWNPRISDTALPSRVVAVDKGKQIFHLYEKKSPLTLKFSTPCTTGQVDGDKQVINDLRTPEGVYFVEYKIASGLDFKEYGGIAYTLNYPNPVDKLRGKTGHGIWIHSKGFGIVPKDTRGCIAIGLKEIDEVGPLLVPGTAVVVGERVATESIPLRDDGTIRHLRMRMDQWTRAWASRSAKLFDFYDAEAYTKAMTESFAAFRANKERLFKRFAWINIFNREVNVLEGPGYWVTWSEQFYRAPNLSTEGIRRLYWQRGKDNQFRIVGMEWLPRNVGMQAAFEKGQLVASLEGPRSDAGAEAPVPPPLSMPETAENLPVAPQPVAAAPAQSIPPVAAVPQVPVIPAESVQPQPTAVAQARPQAPAEPEPLAVVAEKTPQPQPEPPVAAAPVVPAITLDNAIMAQLQQRVEAWRDAWQRRSPDFFDFYDQARYGTLKDIPHRDNFRALKADMARRFRAPWIEVVQRPARMEVRGGSIVTSFEQLLRMPGQQAVQGVRHLYWQPRPDGQYRIVASHWEQQDVGMQTDYLESITTSVTAALEAWRKAWQAGDVDDYMEFYAANASQQGKNKQAIREHKSRIWAKAAPEVVNLSGLRVLVEPQGVRADMTQVYRDSTGRGDKGTKTLFLQPDGNTWRIVREEWAALPPGGEN